MYVSTQLGCSGSNCRCSGRCSRNNRRRPSLRRGPGLGADALFTSTSIGAKAAPIAGSAIASLGPAFAAAGPVGALVGGVLALVTVIFGSHAAAVAREANTLNQAVPAFVTMMQAIFQAANSGQITAADAIAYCDQAQQQYYQMVGSIIKKNGPCTLNSDCTYVGGPNAGNIERALTSCNGPCGVGCWFVEPAVCMAKRLFTAGGGSFSTVNLDPHAGFQGQPPVTFSYSQPSTSVLPASVSQAIAPVEQAFASAGLPSWVLPIAGGLLAAKFIGVI